MLDGAFSVGRVTSADAALDGDARQAGNVPALKIYSGFLLRSPVVSGWPNLGAEAYPVSVPVSDDDIPAGVLPLPRLRCDRVGEDVLLCLFVGEIKTIDIHEHRDTIHFGVDPGNNRETSRARKRRCKTRTMAPSAAPTRCP